MLEGPVLLNRGSPMRATIFGAALLASTALLAVAPSALAQQYGGYGTYPGYGTSAGYGSYGGYGAGSGGLGGYGGYGAGYGSPTSAYGYGAGYSTAYPSTAGYGATGYGVSGQMACQYAGQYPGYC